MWPGLIRATVYSQITKNRVDWAEKESDLKSNSPAVHTEDIKECDLILYT